MDQGADDTEGEQWLTAEGDRDLRRRSVNYIRNRIKENKIKDHQIDRTDEG